MKSLQEFLNSNPVEGITKEVAISDRLKDENGNFFKFKIKAMTNDEYNEAVKKANKINGDDGKIEFNSKLYMDMVVINNTLEPNFKDAESIKKLGLATPEQYLGKVMLAGEIAALAKEINKLSGFNKNMDALIEEAKN